LLSLFHRFPLCPEQNIYRNIALLKSLWNYLSNVWSLIKNGVQTRELCPFYFSAACCPKLISGRVALGDSGITACRNLQLSWFCDILAQGLIGLIRILIPTSCNFFSGSPSLNWSDGWPTGKSFPGAHEWGQSAQERNVLVGGDILGVLESCQV
jgi:hypothetical protein